MSEPQTSPLERLDRLAGDWVVTGDLVEGRTRFEWTQGRSFLLQHFDLTRQGRPLKGLEVIGHLRGVQGPPSDDICSRAYIFGEGLTLDYVYALDGDDLTIWFGARGSDNLMRAKFSEDGARYSGAWRWPGGGYGFEAHKQAWP